MEYIVFVSGSREWQRLDLIENEMKGLEIPMGYVPVLIHGGAQGVDTMAHGIATRLGWIVRSYPITPEEWRQQGRSAGPARNVRMIQTERPHVVLAFRYNNSRGTTHAISVAKKYGSELNSKLLFFKIIDMSPEGIVIEKVLVKKTTHMR